MEPKPIVVSDDVETLRGVTAEAARSSSRENPCQWVQRLLLQTKVGKPRLSTHG